MYPLSVMITVLVVIVAASAGLGTERHGIVADRVHTDHQEAYLNPMPF